MDEAAQSSPDVDVADVDSTPLELGHDLFDVQSELIPVSANWKSIGTALQLKPDFLRNIDARYSGDPRACLSWMVMEWLMRNYNVGKFGEPTWQKLVEAVGHPAGGANIALAKKIARRHKAGVTRMSVLTQQTPTSPQGKTDIQMIQPSPSSTISDHPSFPPPTLQPTVIQRVTSCPSHFLPQTHSGHVRSHPTLLPRASLSTLSMTSVPTVAEMKLDIAALCNELSSISDWFTLGLNLGVQYHQLDQIRRNYSVEGCSGCRREAIVLWLRHIPTASWRDVVHALEKMEENTVAEVIRAKYIVASPPISQGVPTSSTTKADASTHELSKDFARESRQSITANFATFQKKVCSKLLKNGVNPEELRLFVINQFPPGDCIPPSPASVFDIFEAITRHGLWDCLHYSPLVQIIHAFADNDPEMEGWVQSYEKDLKAYCIVTTVEDYIDVELGIVEFPQAKRADCDLDVAKPSPAKRAKYDVNVADPPAERARHNPHYYCPLEWKTKFIDHSLQYLRDVWKRFSSRYLIPESPPTALLDRVRKGCFSVTWLIPSGLILPFLERLRTDTEFFQQYRILRVTVRDQCVYEEVSEKMTPEPEHAEQDKIQALLGPDIEGKPQILADQKETIGSSDYSKESCTWGGELKELEHHTSGVYCGIVLPCDLLTQKLKHVYVDAKWFEGTVNWPKLSTSVFINLALVKKKRIAPNDRNYDKLIRDSLHGLVDDIERKKEHIDVHNIFHYGRSPVKRVLVEGAPGIGKTVLACHLCSEWAMGKILQEYGCVLLVPLRRFQRNVRVPEDLPEYHDGNKLQILDIVNLYLQGNVGFEASEKLIRTSGDKTLMILDGWDELAPKLRQKCSFFYRLITGDLLNKASVLVTSRHTVSSQLYAELKERRIEVMGFNKAQIQEFVETHATEKKDQIISHLKKFPNIQAVSHIPFNLSVICSVAKHAGELPDTLTGLYNEYIRSLLVQGLRKQSVAESQGLPGLGNLSQLPSAAKNVLDSLCKLAFQGVQDKRVVFHARDLTRVGLIPSRNFDAYGLLFSLPCYAGAESEIYYQFHHLTLQEFMAAKGIETFDHNQQVILLNQHHHDKQFQVLLKFLCGITKLEGDDLCKSIISRTRQGNNRDELLLLHCVYEAHVPDLCLTVAEHLKYSVKLSNNPLNATDCLCLSYTIVQAGGEWKLHLRGCNMGAEGLEILRWHLANDQQPRGRPALKIKSFDLMTNFLHLDSDPPGVQVLAEIITGYIPVTEITVNSNVFGDAGTEILARALCVNSTVEYIEMGNCGVTAIGAKYIGDMLLRNSTIKVLFLRWNKLKDEGVCHLASALVQNQSLEELSLGNNGIGHDGLQYLCRMLKVNKTLKVLKIDASQLGCPEYEMLTTVFPHNQTLELLELDKVPIGDTGIGIITNGLKTNPNCGIKRLGLLGCGITDNGVKNICELVWANLIETIHLGSNTEITDAGAKYLAKALECGTSIKTVRLDNTGITEAGKKLLEKASKLSRSGVEVTYVPNIHLWKKLEERTAEWSLICGSSY